MPITKILHEIAFATGPNDNCTKLNEYQIKKAMDIGNSNVWTQQSGWMLHVVSKSKYVVT